MSEDIIPQTRVIRSPKSDATVALASFATAASVDPTLPSPLIKQYQQQQKSQAIVVEQQQQQLLNNPTSRTTAAATEKDAIIAALKAEIRDLKSEMKNLKGEQRNWQQRYDEQDSCIQSCQSIIRKYEAAFTREGNSQSAYRTLFLSPEQKEKQQFALPNILKQGKHSDSTFEIQNSSQVKGNNSKVYTQLPEQQQQQQVVVLKQKQKVSPKIPSHNKRFMVSEENTNEGGSVSPWDSGAEDDDGFQSSSAGNQNNRSNVNSQSSQPQTQQQLQQQGRYSNDSQFEEISPEKVKKKMILFSEQNQQRKQVLFSQKPNYQDNNNNLRSSVGQSIYTSKQYQQPQQSHHGSYGSIIKSMPMTRSEVMPSQSQQNQHSKGHHRIMKVAVDSLQSHTSQQQQQQQHIALMVGRSSLNNLDKYSNQYHHNQQPQQYGQDELGRMVMLVPEENMMLLKSAQKGKGSIQPHSSQHFQQNQMNIFHLDYGKAQQQQQSQSQMSIQQQFFDSAIPHSHDLIQSSPDLSMIRVAASRLKVISSKEIKQRLQMKQPGVAMLQHNQFT